METLYTQNIENFLQSDVFDLPQFIKILQQLLTKKNLYANLLQNNNKDAVELFVVYDGKGTLKICALGVSNKETQPNLAFSNEPDIVKSRLKKAELKLQDDYNFYVRQLECRQKPTFNAAFRNVMTCLKNLDNPNELPLGDEAIALSNYDHTIIAKSQAHGEPPLAGRGIAESFQLSDMTFIIHPDPINDAHFEKIRVKASAETSFNVVRARCNGLGVHGRYKLERVGASYLLLDFEFTQADLFS